MAYAKGYDVSDFQSGTPGDAGFVFIKATEGAHTEQSGYKQKLADARRRKLVVGHYHFLHAENAVADEVDHFCRVVGHVPQGELLALDFEPYGQNVSDAHATQVKNQWLEAVKRHYPDNRVGLYVDRDFWFRTDDNAGDFLWIADYVAPGAPRIRAPWKFHQYTDRPMDVDVYHGTMQELREWAGAAATKPAPAPRPHPQPTPQPRPAPHPGPQQPWKGLQLVPRAEWGARPWREPNGSIPYHEPRKGVKIHYLGTPYTFGPHSTCAAYVRRIQAGHMDFDKWSDIGYSFVVCEHGVVFEGRGLQRRNSANGNVPLNEAHYAVCALVGSSGSTTPTWDQLNGLRDAIEYCQKHGPAGPEIKGHRDGYATDCPGPVLYAWVREGAPRPPGSGPSPSPQPKPQPTPQPAQPTRRQVTLGGLQYGFGANGMQVTAVGRALVAAGFGKHYHDGPGPEWTDADTLNYADYQRSQGFSGADADGVPGERSLRSLLRGAIPLAVIAHAKVVDSARRDPGAPQGATSNPDHVLTVELSLAEDGLLDRKWVDGSFGTKTVTAYSELQKRYGYTGMMADGIPGKDSLTRLGHAHGFAVE
ncbi:peptidoglycan-binding protein [Streptomyces sp. CG1]|uniref:peptidoglycan-binding protein n=1 Tax=Streptomyces sp. CG1 TaxID=1287523 RepID=UPI0034E29361